MWLIKLSIPIILFIVLLWLYERKSLKARGYGLYLPASYKPDGDPLPLMIALYGKGDNWRSFSRASGLKQAANKFGFIVAFPNGYLRQWNDGSRGDHSEDDLAILLELIEVVAADHKIERERIYLVGFSNGGTMTFRVACEEPGIFAGIASICGTMRRLQPCEDDVRASVLLIHGTDDPLSPFEGGEWRYSVPETAKFWAKLNRCDLSSVPEYDPQHFQDRVATYHYEGSPQGHQVLIYLIEGMSHAWPGGAEFAQDKLPDPRFDTPRIIWDFFESCYQAQQKMKALELAEETD